MIWSDQGRGPRPVRTLFLSDLHLGCRHTQAEAALGLMQSISPERVYLVGDFLDGWRLKRRWLWPPSYNAIVKQLMDWAEDGVRLFYTPGNHDGFLRQAGASLDPFLRSGLLCVRDEFLCELADGRQFSVLHGDQFDPIERNVQWLSVLSSFGYDQILSLNWWISRGLPAVDRSPYWLCAGFKDFVKRSIYFMQKFEDRVLDHARSQGLDGVVCGHLHTPRIVLRDGLTYCNVGDWIENCAAVIETPSGQLEQIRYFEVLANSNRETARSPESKPVPLATSSRTGSGRSRMGVGV